MTWYCRLLAVTFRKNFKATAARCLFTAYNPELPHTFTLGTYVVLTFYRDVSLPVDAWSR